MPCQRRAGLSPRKALALLIESELKLPRGLKFTVHLWSGSRRDLLASVSDRLSSRGVRRNERLKGGFFHHRPRRAFARE